MHSEDFANRTAAIDTLLEPFSLVGGTGSWIEAHLVARLGHLKGIPNLQGCGVTVDEVLDLCTRAPGPVLVVFSTSIASDNGLSLCQQLRTLPCNPLICCLVDQASLFSHVAHFPCDAIVSAASFGSGAMHDALLAVRQGQRYLDPSLKGLQNLAPSIHLKPRESQVLQLLSLGMSNKQIGEKLQISPVTVRDYVQSLCRLFDAVNRTDVVFKAVSMGLLNAA